MSPAACEIINSQQNIIITKQNDYRRLQVIIEHDYNYIKFGESVITIMITQIIKSIKITKKLIIINNHE